MKKYFLVLVLLSMSTVASAGASLPPSIQINGSGGNANMNCNMNLGSVPSGTEYCWVVDRGNTIFAYGITNAGASFYCSVYSTDSQFDRIASSIRGGSDTSKYRFYSSNYRCTDGYYTKDSRWGS